MSQSKIATSLPNTNTISYVSHNDVKRLTMTASSRQLREHKLFQMESCADIIVRSVADLVDIPYEVLRGIKQTRKSEVVDIKSCIQAVTDQIIGSIFADVYTHTWLAEYMSCNHASINHRKKKHAALMQTDKAYQDLYERIVAVSSTLSTPGSDLYATMDIRALVARVNALKENLRKWDRKLKEQGKYYDYEANAIKKIQPAQTHQAE